MAFYCYKCPHCGHREEKEFRVGQAPEYVACSCNMAQMERDWSSEGDKAGVAATNFSNKYPYVSSRLPRKLKGCQHDKSGKPIVMSARHEKELASRLGMRRD